MAKSGEEGWQRCPGLDRTSREALRKTIEQSGTMTAEIQALAARCLQERNRMLNEFGEAFAADTGLLPQGMELVECQEGTTTRWFYRRREGSGRAAEIDASAGPVQFTSALAYLLDCLEHEETRAQIAARLGRDTRLFGHLHDFLVEVNALLGRSHVDR